MMILALTDLATILAVQAWHAKIWYALPIMLAVSLVYGATRHELMSEIWRSATRSFLWVTVFMSMILLLIWIGGYWN